MLRPSSPVHLRPTRLAKHSAQFLFFCFFVLLLHVSVPCPAGFTFSSLGGDRFSFASCHHFVPVCACCFALCSNIQACHFFAAQACALVPSCFGVYFDSHTSSRNGAYFCVRLACFLSSFLAPVLDFKVDADAATVDAVPQHASVQLGRD